MSAAPSGKPDGAVVISMEDNNLMTLWEPVLREYVRTSFEALTDDDTAREVF